MPLELSVKKKGTGSELLGERAAKNNGHECACPLFQHASSHSVHPGVCKYAKIHEKKRLR